MAPKFEIVERDPITGDLVTKEYVAGVATGSTIPPSMQAAIDASVAAALASHNGASVTPVQTITYNGDGTVNTVTVGGVTLTYTYNTDGTIATESDGTTTRTFTYTSGSLTAVA